MKIKDIENALISRKDRGTLEKAVTQYALEILSDMDYLERNDKDIDIAKLSRNELEKLCLNGASDWYQYSWGGCSLCYNYDIQHRLYPPSKCKYNRSGEKLLNEQARTLQVAFNRIRKTINAIR